MVKKGGSQQPCSKVILAVICFFLGYLGIHRFVCGKIGTGILMILTFGGFYIWVIIDFIVILCGNFETKDGIKITK